MMASLSVRMGKSLDRQKTLGTSLITGESDKIQLIIETLTTDCLQKNT